MGRFTTGFQLALAFGFALIVMLGFAVNGLLSQKAVETSLHEFCSVEVGRIRLVERWISASEDAALRYMVINKTNDEGMKETLIESAQARTKEAGEMAAAVAAAASTDEEKQWLVHFAEVEKALATALDSVTQYKNLGDMAGASAMFDCSIPHTCRHRKSTVRNCSATGKSSASALMRSSRPSRPPGSTRHALRPPWRCC